MSERQSRWNNLLNSSEIPQMEELSGLLLEGAIPSDPIDIIIAEDSPYGYEYFCAQSLEDDAGVEVYHIGYPLYSSMEAAVLTSVWFDMQGGLTGVQISDRDGEATVNFEGGNLLNAEINTHRGDGAEVHSALPSDAAMNVAGQAVSGIVGAIDRYERHGGVPTQFVEVTDEFLDGLLQEPTSR